MSSIFQSFQKRSFLAAATSQALPVSQTDSKEQGLRRRGLSSLSLNDLSSSSTATPTSATSSWVFRRSKSVSSMGEYAGTSVRKWWDWGWAWILSRKPTFAKDLEMNQEETALLGCHDKGTWRHVVYKVRSELRRLVGSDHVGHQLPQTFRYDDGSVGKRTRHLLQG